MESTEFHGLQGFIRGHPSKLMGFTEVHILSKQVIELFIVHFQKKTKLGKLLKIHNDVI